MALLGAAGPLDRRQIATRLGLGVATVHEHTEPARSPRRTARP